MVTSTSTTLTPAKLRVHVEDIPRSPVFKWLHMLAPASCMPVWQEWWCLDVASTHDPSTRSLFFQSRRSYRPAEGHVEAKRRQRPGPPPATTNRLLAEPGGGPWVNCAWVEVSRGRFVGGRIVKVPGMVPLPHPLESGREARLLKTAAGPR